jgi:hypothetical protein
LVHYPDYYYIGIENISFNPINVQANANNQIVINIIIYGFEEAQNLNIEVKDGDIQVAQILNVSISSNETKEIIIDWSPQIHGNHTITVTIYWGDTALSEKKVNVYVDPAEKDNGNQSDSFKLWIIFLFTIIIVLLGIFIFKVRGKKISRKEKNS